MFDGPERTVDDRSYLELQYTHTFASDLEILGRLSYDRYAYYGSYIYDYSEPGIPLDPVGNRDRAVGSWLTSEWHVRQSFFDRHTLLAGVEYRGSLEQQQLNYDETLPRTYTVDDHQRTDNAAVFAQGEFTLAEHLLLNAGLRYDHYFGSFGGTLNPRVGLIVSPSQRTTIKFLYGDAFRAPSVYERFYYPATQGATLQPETIRTYEIALEQYAGLRDRFTVSTYRYEVKGLISQLATATEDVYFANLSRATANGVELEWERKYEHGLLARVSYALQRTEDGESHRTLTSSPRHLAKLNFGLPLADRFDAGLELQYQSAVETLTGQHSDGFVLGNLSLTARARPDLQLSAGLYNIFNTRYAYPGAEDHLQDVIVQDGRTLRVSLRYAF